MGCNLRMFVWMKRWTCNKAINNYEGTSWVPPRTLHKYVYTGVRGTPYRIPNVNGRMWHNATEKFVDMRGIPVSKNRVYKKLMTVKKSRVC